jgi:hypothetical protein
MVMGLRLNDEARAYPVKLFWFPEEHVVNDELAGRPVTASWCSLALSGSIWDRRVGGEVLEFGALEEPDRSVLQLYDRRTRSQWNQVTGRAVAGPLSGKSLSRIPSLLTTWGRWKTMYPDTTVYLADTNPGRAVPTFNEASMLAVVLGAEERSRDTEWVMGLEGNGNPWAFPVRLLIRDRVSNAVVDRQPLALFLTEDLSTVLVWERAVDGRVLTFSGAGGDRLRDTETGSLWDAVTGASVSGPLAGRRLAAFPFATATWYAWRSHHSGTRLGGEGR